MEQAANKHGPMLDDEMKAATGGMVSAGRATRAEEWRQQEPSGEEQPDVDLAPDETLTGATPPGMSSTDVERRSRIASFLDRTTFPAVRSQIVQDATDNHAPDDVVADLRRLPDGREFDNVNQVWATLGGGTEQQRF